MPDSLPDGITLRPVTTADLEAVRALLRGAKLPLDGVEDQFGEAWVVAARPEGRIVGVAALERWGNDGLLRSLMVAPPLRGLGLGMVLTRDRLARARSLGLSSVWLLTTTAAPFFEHFDFERVARRSAPAALAASPEFTTACPDTATCMRLALA